VSGVSLNADALVEYEEALEYVGEKGAAPGSIELLVNAWSRRLQAYLGRQLKPQTEAGTTYRFRYDGSGYLSFQPFELADCESIVLGSDLPLGVQRTLLAQTAELAAEYRLEPRNKTKEGTWLWAALPEAASYLGRATARKLAQGSEVAVTGTWGASEVPASVKLACLIMVKNQWMSPEGYATRTVGELSIAEPLTSLPPDVVELLEDVHRKTYG
jgi:hypothetical protein